jgi:phosphotriesterase-related protein
MAATQPLAMPSGTVRTVTGDRPAADFAAVAVHEHVLFDLALPGTLKTGVPLDMKNRWQVDYRSNEMPDNAAQQDRGRATDELVLAMEDGCDLVVDQTVRGIGRDVDGLAAASRGSGVAVVAAAGTYTASYLGEAERRAATEELAERFVSELTEGIDGTGIRAGLIGEIGCSWPLEPVEERALHAAAAAQKATGAGISVHPGRHPEAPFQIVSILEAAGADLSRTVICHMDRTYPDGSRVAELARTGVMVEWDFFGIETSHYWMADHALPTDRQRLDLIRGLFDQGLGERVLVSHDICTKTRLRNWGGHGYGHLFRNIRPLMARLGFALAEIDGLLRLNPLRLLALPERIKA